MYAYIYIYTINLRILDFNRSKGREQAVAVKPAIREAPETKYKYLYKSILVYDDDDDVYLGYYRGKMVSYKPPCLHFPRKTHKHSEYGISNEQKNESVHATT
jgi:hypothetical protein